MELIGLEEAAQRAGLHYMTVYRHVRTGRLPAVQRDGRWWVDPSDLPLLSERRRPGRSAGPARWNDARRRLVDRMLAADSGGAWTVVEQALTRGAAPADVYLRLLGPALQAVGEGWAEGELSVQDEHRATAVALRLAGRLAQLFVGRGTSKEGTVLLGGAPGDYHMLPVLMVADLLRSRHIKVVDLGANVPEEAFLEAAESIPDLRAVGISLSDAGRSQAAASLLTSLRRRHPGVLLLAGGPALLSRADAVALGADEWAPDGLAVADILQGVVAGEEKR